MELEKEKNENRRKSRRKSSYKNRYKKSFNSKMLEVCFGFDSRQPWYLDCPDWAYVRGRSDF